MKRFCAYAGCGQLTDGSRYCPAHEREAMKALAQRERESAKIADRKRGSAAARGYDAQWQKFRDWYLRQPEHVFCALHISRDCAGVADCIDHIVPLEMGGAKYDMSNLQPSCRACNVKKGRTVLRGNHVYGE